MKKTLLLYFILSSFMIVETHAQSTGVNKEFLLQEVFTNVHGNEEGFVSGTYEGLEPVDVSKFDNNKMEWGFTDVYAGEQCLLVKEGGTITLPAIPELYGNAAFWFYTESWNGEMDSSHHELSVNEGGLTTNRFDATIAMQDPPMCL